ncbi:phosphopantetheine-binding protein [Microbulbifer taiwanensis]|uniref:phosphopantetheine-binding protein n=1 Tax=Microbulbifer taiwanensis TaxID=986746 RepID=UPI00361C1A6F
MLPAAIVELGRLPLNANGKVDRKALPDAELQSARYEAPRGETEQTLAGIWAELLNVQRVGRNDNFFELGGHSLLALTLLERMRAAAWRRRCAACSSGRGWPILPRQSGATGAAKWRYRPTEFRGRAMPSRRRC